jgi:hypothetical protein
MKRDDETREEYRERMTIKNKENWMCLGEVEQFEETKYSCFELNPFPHQYLFRHKKGSMWSIAPSYYDVGFVNPYVLDVEVSVLTFLVVYISADRGMIKCDNFKIRFVGMTNWLSVDQDYLNGRISLKKLNEKLIKTENV